MQKSHAGTIVVPLIAEIPYPEPQHTILTNVPQPFGNQIITTAKAKLNNLNNRNA